ncbi:DUF2957 domain-containing protein [Cupriavidus sp. CV2]|uniref:DUF2957 domain-containing protein n=1 Tax=Cupriavidus ulmosensis TaxID=3065913 RepID=UPI00296AB428|nr:DUF2957 domain-containing protein [Cupriavidus sp. CV2]MDW3684725.1 DUF2957 domain-containing protein [Cupriavidus sp. CV2]
MARLHVSKGLAAMAGTSLALMLAACGGDGTPTPGKADVASCASTNSCAASGPTTTGSAAAPLCPAALDYSTVYTGGTGAGEFVKMQFDTTAMTYRLQVIESPVPKAPKSVSPTRAGVTITGTIAHLTSLPTAEQNRCALVLQSAKPSDNASQAIIDPHSPPVIFVGNGVAGGGVPGATISFDGILGFGVIPEKTFPIYPVLAFAQTETDFAKVAGTYNVLGYHQVPSGGALSGGSNFAPATAQTTEVLKADGSCSAGAGSCVTTGNPWAARAQNDGAFESNNASGNLRYPAFYNKAITSGNSSRAKGVLVVGKLNGALVPLLIRVGFAQADSILSVNVDDESGLAMLAPTTNLTNAQLNGGYVGSGSDLVYTSSIVQGNAVGLIDPLTMNAKGGYQLDLTQAKPGVVTTVDNSGTPGALISTGHVFAHLAGAAGSNPTFRVSVFAAP